MFSKPKRKVTTASDLELIDPTYYRRLWLAARNISEKVPRRGWLDELADCFRDFDGDIVYPTGEIFQLPDLDEVFGDDAEARWLSYYLKPDESGVNPKSRVRKIERLRMIDLYFRIKHHSIASHFNK